MTARDTWLQAAYLVGQVISVLVDVRVRVLGLAGHVRGKGEKIQ